MTPKTKLIVSGSLFMLAVIGSLIVLLITTTPRYVKYSVFFEDATRASEKFLARRDIEKPEEKTLIDVLYDFSIIKREEDIDDSDFSVEIFETLRNSDPNYLQAPMTLLNQLNGSIVSTRDFMAFQASGNIIREIYFAEPCATSKFTISAYNYNLRSRQTAIFLFFIDDDRISGYVFNNVWLYPRNATNITALISPCGVPLLIADLDYNLYYLD